MFTTIYRFIKNLFTIDYYKNNKKIIINENLWVKNELEKWKIDKYSDNRNLAYIPSSKILEKKEQLKKEFIQKYNS